MIRMNVSYRGHVQGVGFRATAERVAQGFPVAGWVRNEPDGSVSLLAQGPLDDVNAFLDALRARLDHHIAKEDRSPPKGPDPHITGFHTRFD